MGYVIFRPKEGPSLAGKDTGVTLTDYTGQTVRFGQFINGFSHKPLVVFFWATWCPYCKAEFNDLASLKQQYGDHVEVVAVDRGENRSDAKDFTDALPPLNGIITLIDADDALFKKLGGFAVPETIFINGNGEEIARTRGPITADQISASAKKILQ